jgi:hypothetical protein
VTRTHRPFPSRAAVYAVPDERVDDDGMADLVLRPGAELGPEELTALLEAQRGLGTNLT